MLLEDIKREPTFKELKFKNLIVKKEYIEFYNEITAGDELFKNNNKKVGNGEKILIPGKVQKNGIVWRHDYGHNFYTYEFAVKEGRMYLNGFIYKNGKWKRTISSITNTKNFNSKASALLTVSALLVGVIVAPVLRIVDLLKTPFKSKKIK
ncbi:hypothetical protein GUB10_15590 [Salegentibacter sp. BLCTC]|uniref:hypothetical protein n=1 Tax=Salegentibacter sp. BLCTC TaxID=2697368 RepID=UPI00187B3602|nr:hypothetical protein [Salegentibacter sp. BLCTC]MBE7641756.1 hypothetical protein [Salegentibacter sp. BLCTC]